MFPLFQDRPKFIVAIVLANIALSFCSVMLDSVVNNDGITYLAMAELYLDGDWETAKSYYSWPFYPLMIAAFSKVFFIDVTLAAHVLNTFLATSLTLAFVCIVGELSNNHFRTLLIAALVILLFPSITKYRAYIIRDFGYLSCYLWSVYFIFRFCNTAEKKHLVGWFTATALSCLFRFEGIILMLVAPYFLFMFSNWKIPHRKKILASSSVTIIVASVIIISWYLQDKYAASLELAQMAGEDVNSVFELLLGNINTQLADQSGGILAYLAPIFSNVMSVSSDLLRRMAGIYLLVCLISYFKGFALSPQLVKRMWLVYLATNLILLIGFSIANNLSVSRYTLATSLTLLILAPFALNYWIDKLPDYAKDQRIAVYFTILLLAAVSIKELDVRTNKRHLAEAGSWIHKNIGDGGTLYSNERLIVHYAKLGAKSNFVDLFTNERMHEHLSMNQIGQYDFIALSITQKDQQERDFGYILQQRYGAPIKLITGNEQRTVMIFSSKLKSLSSLAKQTSL